MPGGLVMGGVPQESFLGWMLFDILIHDTAVRKRAPSAGLMVEGAEGRGGTWRDVDRIQKWAYVNQTRFNEAKCFGWVLGWDRV